MRHDGDTLHLEGPVTMETVPALLTGARAACRNGATRIDFGRRNTSAVGPYCSSSPPSSTAV